MVFDMRPCLDGTSSADLLVLIMSRPTLSGAHARAVARQSWAHWRSPVCRVRFRFVLGHPAAGADSSNSSEAHDERDDVARLDVSEGYDSLGRKVLLALAWALEHESFSYLLKTDDDSYVCIGGLLRWLAAAQRDDAEAAAWLYAGTPLAQRCAGLELVPLFKQIGVRGLQDDRCRRGWHFPKPTMHGCGYLLSRRLTEHVVRRFRQLSPPPSAEDVSVSLLIHWSSGGDSGRMSADGGASGIEHNLVNRSLAAPFAARSFGAVPFANRFNPRLLQGEPFRCLLKTRRS